MQLIQILNRMFDPSKPIKRRGCPQVLAFIISIGVCFGVVLQATSPAQGETPDAPELIVIGDSQLSFGAGQVMHDFFKNITSHCKNVSDPMAVLDKVEKMKTALIGARSTSLESWLTTSGAAHSRLCRKDKKWGVNASVWGTLKKTKSSETSYVQIGERDPYKFCKRGKAPLQALVSDRFYQPRLIVFNLLGNGVGRWARSRKLADKDVARLTKLMPENLPCVFMTTMPNYSKSRNRTRLKAQKNIEAAFAAHGSRCAFVRGLTPKTIALIQGQSSFFRRRKSGKVKDPFHPNKQATKRALALTGRKICTALIDTLGGAKLISSNTRDTLAAPPVE